MYFESYYFGGMHLAWWIVSALLLFWIFATPKKKSGESTEKETPLDIQESYFASEQINNEAYQEKKTSPFINSKFSHRIKEEVLNRSEILLPNNEQQLHDAYYNEKEIEITDHEHNAFVQKHYEK